MEVLPLIDIRNSRISFVFILAISEFGGSTPTDERPRTPQNRLNYERKKKILIDFQDKKALMMRLSVLFGKPINYESLRIQDYYNQ